MAYSATRARRVRRQWVSPPNPSRAAVWITDLMLREAMEKYQRRCLVTNRTLSSSRGLFECRRRPLGKRHMADMLISPPPYRPTWWFELMGNQYAWQWQSPTSAQHRREKEQQITFSGLADKCMRWLEASDLDMPFLDPPTQAAATSMQNLQLTEDNIARSSSKAASLYDTSLLKGVSTLTSAIRGVATMDKPTLDSLTDACCRSLRSALHSGDFTIDQIYTVMEPLGVGELDPRLSEPQIRSIDRSIAKTVIYTIAVLRRHSHDSLYEGAWSAIIGHVFSMAPSVFKFRRFSYIMSQASPMDIHNIDDALYRQIIREFAYTHGDGLRNSGVIAPWTMRLSYFARSLAQIPQTKFDSISRAVTEEVWHPDGKRQHRFTWLLIQAQLSHSTAQDMAALTLEYQDEYGPMSGSELRVLAMARLVSEGRLDLQTTFQLSRMYRAQPCSRWPDLAEAVMDLGGTDSLKSLVRWLQSIRGLSCLIRSLIFTNIDPEESGLALSSRRVMGKIMEDAGISPRSLEAEVDFISAKRLKIRGRGTDIPPSELKSRMHMRRGMMEFLEWLAHWYLLSPLLTDRQALRGVEWCLVRYEWMANDNGRGSSVVLAVLARVLMRDLTAGQWGRTSRLRWLMTKIEKYQGHEQARKALKTLNDWRNMTSAQQEKRP